MGAIRSRSCLIIASLLGALSCSGAVAQGYPNKPIRLVLPYPAGAPSDMVGRALGQKLSEQLGQNIVADNRTGAGGNLGIAAVAKAPPDGYTILITSPAIAISPSLYSNLGYDAEKDLAPVARVATIENVLVVHPSVPARTLKQFIALAHAHPGKLNFGSGGAGTTNHLANELLKSIQKINMVHVPYKGATLATVALMSGEVDEVIVAVAPALPLVRAGKVRPLAVLSERRVPTLPDVPTAKEAGVDNFQVSIWYGMFVPAGTPHEVIARLGREVINALEAPDLRRRMTAAGIEPWPGTAEELRKLLRSETARYAEIIRSAGLRRD
ncbi:MAG: tripartite tricarboxylate transporter substrate binding protein [Betaproteobacteria bacterium]|nr:tripartite tricarboxylate transporter substrate binding protein [Betaproteobacteria bacterium]